MQIAVQRTRPAVRPKFRLVSTLSTQAASGLPWSVNEDKHLVKWRADLRGRIISPASREVAIYVNALARDRAVPKQKLSLSLKATLVRYAMRNAIAEA